MKYIILVLTGLVFASCGKNEKSDTSFSATKSYEFKEVSTYFGIDKVKCTTEKHNFTSKVSTNDLFSQYCNALQDSSLNKNCAETLRHEEFQKNCETLGLKWK